MGSSSSKKPSPSRLRSNIEDQFSYSHNFKENNSNEIYSLYPQHYALEEFDRTKYDLNTYRRDSKSYESNRTFKPTKYENDMNIEQNKSVRNMDSKKFQEPILHENFNQPIFAPTRPVLVPPQINGCTLTRRLSHLNEENRPRASSKKASINPDVINPSHESLIQLYDIQPYEMRKLKKFFNQFSGNDRKMNFHEFVKLYGNLNPSLRGPDIVNIAEQAFLASDTNDDGLLSFNEFLIAYCLTKPNRSFAGFPDLYKPNNSIEQHNFPDKFSTISRNKTLKMLPFYPSTEDSDQKPLENYSHKVEPETSQQIEIYEKKRTSQIDPLHSKIQVLADQQPYQSQPSFQQQAPQYEHPQTNYMESNLLANTSYIYQQSQLNPPPQPSIPSSYLPIQPPLPVQPCTSQQAVQKYVQSIQQQPHLNPYIPNEKNINDLSYPHYEKQQHSFQQKTIPAPSTPPSLPLQQQQQPQQYQSPYRTQPPYQASYQHQQHIENFEQHPQSQYEYQPQSQYEYQPQSQYEYQPQSQYEYQPQFQYEYQPQSQYEKKPESQFDPRPQYQYEQQQSHYPEQTPQKTRFRNQPSPIEEPSAEPNKRAIPSNELNHYPSNDRNFHLSYHQSIPAESEDSAEFNQLQLNNENKISSEYIPGSKKNNEPSAHQTNLNSILNLLPPAPLLLENFEKDGKLNRNRRYHGSLSKISNHRYQHSSHHNKSEASKTDHSSTSSTPKRYRSRC